MHLNISVLIWKKKPLSAVLYWKGHSSLDHDSSIQSWPYVGMKCKLKTPPRVTWADRQTFLNVTKGYAKKVKCWKQSCFRYLMHSRIFVVLPFYVCEKELQRVKFKNYFHKWDSYQICHKMFGSHCTNKMKRNCKIASYKSINRRFFIFQFFPKLFVDEH